MKNSKGKYLKRAEPSKKLGPEAAFPDSPAGVDARAEYEA